MTQWIYTKDRLPDEGTKIILKVHGYDCDPEYFVGELEFSKNHKRHMFVFEDYCCEIDIIEAWMIIPKLEKNKIDY